MAVVFGTGASAAVNVTPGNGVNTGASPSITTPTANPVIVVTLAWFHDTVTLATPPLTLTGFTGTIATVVEQLVSGGTDSHIAKIVVKAPTANTAGTVQGNFSAATDFKMVVETWSGAHQTDPCPTADAQSNSTATTPETLTPLNLTAADGSSGGAVNGAGQDLIATTPNGVYLSNGGTPDFDVTVGYATGITGVTLGSNGTQVFAKAVVRVAAAATVTTTPMFRGV